MAEIDFREYITPASKRAAAISSTFSALFALKSVGAMELEETTRLPLLNLPISTEYALILFPAITIALFFMWATRYWYERKYIGAVRQQRTQTIESELKNASQGRFDKIKEAVVKEDQFQDVLTNADLETRQAWLYDGGARPGFRLSPAPEHDEIASKAIHWRDIKRVREETLGHEQDVLNLTQTLRELSLIDSRLSLHSQAAYVWTPITLFVIAVLSPIIAFSMCFYTIHG